MTDSSTSRSRPDAVAIPLRRSLLGLLSVEVELDGRPATLLVDTGASATVIDSSRAAGLGLISEGSDRQAVGCFVSSRKEGARGVTGGGARPVSTAEVQRMTLGGADLGRRTLTLVDLAHVNTQFVAAGAEPVDGVLGADVLAPAASVIDYRESSLRLRKVE